MHPSADNEIERFLLTGEHDWKYLAWPGEGYSARARLGDAALRQALTRYVDQRAGHSTIPAALDGLDVAAYTGNKVAPMVYGLFAASEQAAVLDVLVRSVVFMTRENIAEVIAKAPWLSTAWKVADIFLTGCGAEGFRQDADQLVGLSEGTTCYVSAADYFCCRTGSEDFVVHEAAHIFHNCKRTSIGLPEIRNREWLLPIEFRKRETFAYACEAYSCILERASSLRERRQLLAELERGPMPPDERVDAGEYIDILRRAVEARNGWKRILESCVEGRSFNRPPLEPGIRSAIC